MFYYISGKLAKLDVGMAVIDAGGVGYKFTVSQSTYAQIHNNPAAEKSVTLLLGLREWARLCCVSKKLS